MHDDHTRHALESHETSQGIVGKNELFTAAAGFTLYAKLQAGTRRCTSDG